MTISELCERAGEAEKIDVFTETQSGYVFFIFTIDGEHALAVKARAQTASILRAKADSVLTRLAN